MTINVHRAERRKAKLRLAITGPSGSGKTYGALQIAKGLVGPSGKILLADTERGSGELYADMAVYDVAPMEPPYLTENYIEVIKYAEDNGYDCIILDSISHAWNGQGGILEQNSELSARSNNSFTTWAKLTPKQNMFVDAMLNSKIHVIATMRSKTEYALVQDSNGKTHPEKRALAPIQRDGIDYEFTIVFDIAPNHTAEASKDRSGIFNDTIFTLSEDTGRMLNDWLEKGTSTPVQTPTIKITQSAAPTVSSKSTEKKAPKNPYSKPQVDSIRAKYIEKGWNTKVIDEAQFDAATWDGDIINADFQKRNAASTSAPAPAKVQTPSLPAEAPKAASVVLEPKSVCPVCGKPSMTKEEATQIECLADTKVFDHKLCKECCTKWYNERLEKQAALNQKMPKCTDCGKPITEPDAVKTSKEKYGAPLCRECMSKRIASDLKAKQESKALEDEGKSALQNLVDASKKDATISKPVEPKTESKQTRPDKADAGCCSVCGKKMTKGELSKWMLFNPGKPPVCSDCNKQE